MLRVRSLYLVRETILLLILYFSGHFGGDFRCISRFLFCYRDQATFTTQSEQKIRQKNQKPKRSK